MVGGRQLPSEVGGRQLPSDGLMGTGRPVHMQHDLSPDGPDQYRSGDLSPGGPDQYRSTPGGDGDKPSDFFKPSPIFHPSRHSSQILIDSAAGRSNAPSSFTALEGPQTTSSSSLIEDPLLCGSVDRSARPLVEDLLDAMVASGGKDCLRYT